MNPSLDKHMHIRLAVKPEQIQRLTLKTFYKEILSEVLNFFSPYFLET